MSFNRKISALLHPIIYPVLVSLGYFILIPRFYTFSFKVSILLIIFVGSYLVPLLILFLFKKMDMIQSYHMHSIVERKFPLLLFAFISVLMSRMLFKMQFINDLAFYFVAGALALVLSYLFLWLRTKVSIHTLGVGSIIGFVMYISYTYQINLLWFLGILFLFFGLIARARLALEVHTFSEVILGLFIGILTQVLVPYLFQNIYS